MPSRHRLGRRSRPRCFCSPRLRPSRLARAGAAAKRPAQPRRRGRPSPLSRLSPPRQPRRQSPTRSSPRLPWSTQPRRRKPVAATTPTRPVHHRARTTTTSRSRGVAGVGAAVAGVDVVTSPVRTTLVRTTRARMPMSPPLETPTRTPRTRTRRPRVRTRPPRTRSPVRTTSRPVSVDRVVAVVRAGEPRPPTPPRTPTRAQRPIHRNRRATRTSPRQRVLLPMPPQKTRTTIRTVPTARAVVAVAVVVGAAPVNPPRMVPPPRTIPPTPSCMSANRGTSRAAVAVAVARTRFRASPARPVSKPSGSDVGTAATQGAGVHRF